MTEAQDAKKPVPELDSILEHYDRKVLEDIFKPHTEAVKGLNSKYLAALDRNLEAAQVEDKLEDALAIKGEREALVKGTWSPDRSEKDLKGALAGLRETYLAALAGLESERDVKLQPHRRELQRQLDELVVKLTREGRLDEALPVKEWKDSETAPREQGGMPTSDTDTPESGPVDWAVIERFFVKKSWFSISRAEYSFDRDGKGERIHAGVSTDFTWQRRDDGLVEILRTMSPGGAPVTWFFKFDNRRTAIFGTSPNMVKDPLTAE